MENGDRRAASEDWVGVGAQREGSQVRPRMDQETSFWMCPQPRTQDDEGIRSGVVVRICAAHLWVDPSSRSGTLNIGEAPTDFGSPPVGNQVKRPPAIDVRIPAHPRRLPFPGRTIVPRLFASLVRVIDKFPPHSRKRSQRLRVHPKRDSLRSPTEPTGLSSPPASL